VTTARPGIDGCGDCGVRVLFALTVQGDVIALDPDPGAGPLVVMWDCTDTPRVRSQPGGRLRDGEHRYARHVLSCIALAPVVDLFPAPLPSQPTARRHARAR
jgi:hypothetical protein